MTSGIYQLTFPNGQRYIGKSVDIDERWRQHLDKMQKGKAAKPMQDAWNRYHDFTAEVIFKCHPDHIDIMEECLIARMNPELNTTRTPDRLPGLFGEDFHQVVKYFNYSTVEHITKIIEKDTQLKIANSNISNLEEANEELAEQRSKEELQADINNRIANLQEDCDQLIVENEELTVTIRKLEKQIEYLNRPWWKKLFS